MTDLTIEIPEPSVLSRLTEAMRYLTAIPNERLTEKQRLLMADVLWPLGELVDTVLEGVSQHHTDELLASASQLTADKGFDEKGIAARLNKGFEND